MMDVLSNDDDNFEASTLGLGELASLTINNDADALAYDVRIGFHSSLLDQLTGLWKDTRMIVMFEISHDFLL